MAEGAGEATDAQVTVTYEEKDDGKTYELKREGGGTGCEFGSEISLFMSVTAQGEEDPVLAFGLYGATPKTGVAESAHDAALQGLRESDLYKNAGLLIAASLGVESAMPRLITLGRGLDESDRGIVVGLLERRAYQPREPAEEATLAIWKGDFTRCVALGEPAVDPLLEYVERFAGEPWGEGDKIKEAVRTLVKMGQRRVAGRLLRQFKEHGAADGSGGVAVALLEAVEALGDASALPDLDEAQSYEWPGVADAARRAAATIREREGK